MAVRASCTDEGNRSWFPSVVTLYTLTGDGLLGQRALASMRQDSKKARRDAGPGINRDCGDTQSSGILEDLEGEEFFSKATDAVCHIDGVLKSVYPRPGHYAIGLYGGDP
ncbi:hypothetical protein Hypma_014284 [Hypsizygus marmoreus]|uniref:Uncharacterized protein n=1 Tax=Hypsizygus marmoreus TaxID=39966 RepID=A0A369JEM5_HYPMA|nr:hypothetical protein Hypma_014284 [Hypsizygus marmoreus]